MACDYDFGDLPVSVRAYKRLATLTEVYLILRKFSGVVKQGRTLTPNGFIVQGALGGKSRAFAGPKRLDVAGQRRSLRGRAADA